ncbi:hypothetical protein PENTCL1PPCAC_783, partial [Pristionchus entomophagus]
RSIFFFRMTDNSSNIVLRWEIDNAAATFTSRNAQTRVFNEGGFEWIAGFRPEYLADTANMFLACCNQRGGEWKCEADVEYIAFRTGKSPATLKKSVKFNEGERVHELFTFGVSSSQLDMGFIKDKAVLEFHINIINSEGGSSIENTLDLSKFSSSNETRNVTLLIGDRKLQVSKEFLAIHSPVFNAMFYGNFAEKEKEEIEIKDVVYEEFVDLLHLIFPGRAMVTDSTVLHILALGDRFQMERVLDLSERFIRDSEKFKTAEKLRIADQYRLSMLRDFCLQTFSTAREIGKLQSTPEYPNFSDKMKVAICDRMMNLVNLMI